MHRAEPDLYRANQTRPILDGLTRLSEKQIGPLAPAISNQIDVDGHFYWAAVELTTAGILTDESGPEERTAVGEAKAFLRDILGEGPRLWEEITEEARNPGISDAILRRSTN